ncbi:hypothetical protein QTA58_11245 [Neorhizobium sp. CSC1952]|uniref:hypothetical protein n=1 Tax=Neorhizobium sp. CSC1952 TaxID=2978974 RepID=UPI0025A560B1|nr:hypothetical protein [Rhizobium sp. CSC1952]WJR69269.1 hypothetical protein QTA58_11245 [Rhizobium sp. CSC1952]
MIANRMKPVLAALVLVAAFATTAEARDRWHHDRGHRHHRVENNRWDRQGDGHWNRPAEIDRMAGVNTRSIRRLRQLGGFYGGAIEAYPVRGNGIYFLRDAEYYWPLREQSRVTLAPKAKIIDVEQQMGGNAFASQACAFEAGVCVIRGGN